MIDTETIVKLSKISKFEFNEQSITSNKDLINKFLEITDNINNYHPDNQSEITISSTNFYDLRNDSDTSQTQLSEKKFTVPKIV